MPSHLLERSNERREVFGAHKTADERHRFLRFGRLGLRRFGSDERDLALFVCIAELLLLNNLKTVASAAHIVHGVTTRLVNIAKTRVQIADLQHQLERRHERVHSVDHDMNLIAACELLSQLSHNLRQIGGAERVNDVDHTAARRLSHVKRATEQQLHDDKQHTKSANF